ncbi:HAD-IC family P-type ATPase [uncultured Phycicoccus sp.]|uniref:HAD-IC family P-type ATPase n=1 Tax=uncultured Phycicoccus sp. TaxID=661422 RepID=UPI0026214C2B|nr:HAD-IC family P-type ATPase [uncultured Phycicoccus sp.]
MTTSAPPSPGHPPHGVPAPEVVAALATDRLLGLSTADADERLLQHGPNTLPEDPGTGLLLRALRQFHHPLIYVLLVAGGVTAALGEYVDSAVIFAVVLLNALIGFIQEHKAETALQSLRSMVLPEARVVRDGRARVIASERLVLGDLVLLEAGERAPADLRVLEGSELRVDESALTGESLPVHKEDLTLPADTVLADRRNMVHAGTLVTTGTGAGAVVATGVGTELGAIHRLVEAAELLATPLTRKLSRFTRDLTVVILGLAALTFAVGLLRGQETAEIFTAAVALAVGAIPEGLPAAITIVLAIGVTRMARRRAVVRRLPAVETLGSTTVICSDKTGTLTENRMAVRSLWVPGTGDVAVPGSSTPPSEPPPLGAALRWSLLAGAACNDARLDRHDGEWAVVGDPTEAALLVVAAEAGLPQDEVATAYPRVATIAFDSARQFMATLHRAPADGTGHVALAKGAAERLVQMCGGQLTPDGERVPLDHRSVEDALDRLSGAGLRVLATAVVPDASPAEFADGELDGRWVLTGLQGMLDPPRRAAVDAVRACRTAGISVKMITGDHAATARAIATQVGLLEDPPGPGDVLTGTDLAALTVTEYPDAISRAVVLARVSPEQKLRLVEALQARGHVVAMTGDGVNDAPALRQADIGVAMGRSGTEVAKDAADIVLTDDDFATIEAAVEEGRGIFDNLTKFITWTLPTNIAEGLVILVAILLGTVLPIQPTQILWINMTTAVALGLMLAFEPKEAGVMTRPPRDPGQAILTRTLLSRVLLLSAMLVGGSWWLFEWELANGASLAEARTAAVNVFVAVEAFYLLNCRSLTQSVWRVGLWSNPWVIVGIGVQLVAQLALTYAPVMHRIFDTAPLDAGTWLRIVAFAALASSVVAGEKWLRRRGEERAHLAAHDRSDRLGG